MTDVFWVRLDQTIDRAWLDAHPDVRCLCAPFTGLDGVDETECQKRGIHIISLRGDREFLDTITATAELTIGLMLALLRKIPVAAEHARAGGWERERFAGRDLADCTVGIVGYGRIGRQVKERLIPFGCQVLPTNSLSHKLLDFFEIVTVHVPLNEETRSMFGSPEFTAMQTGSYFINTSRGEVVDESALLDALESGHLAGAALDVVCNERGERNPRLLEFARKHPDRLLITPHVGGNAQPSRARAEQRIAEKLAAWKTGLAKIPDPA